MRIVVRVNNSLNVVSWKPWIKLTETLDNIARVLLVLGKDYRLAQLLTALDMDALLHERD